MKSRTPFQEPRTHWSRAALLVACLAALAVSAAETNAPPAEEPPAEEPLMSPEEFFEGGPTAYNNWIELSAGAFFVDGNESQFQQRHRAVDGPFGGIEDFHLATNLTKNILLTVDGRALFEVHDYDLRLQLSREKLGFLRFTYDEFRTWYNGDGGFYPPTGTWYPLDKDALALDRGEISVEGGLTLEKLPALTFKYTHRYREGQKSSTIRGITHPTGGGLTRGLSPSFYDIDEYSDAFQLDARYRIKKTDIGLGVRYETGTIDNGLKITQAPGEVTERKITDRQETSYDLLNAYAFTETWMRNNLFFSSGFSFTDLDNDFSGSRIYGSDFDVGYAPNAMNGSGYYDLNGGSRLREYVLNLNLLAVPAKHFTIVPSVRVQKEDVDADFTGLQTLGINAATPFSGNSDRDLLDVRGRLDLRYTGLTNWVLYARGEWTEGEGNLKEIGGTGPVGGVGTPTIQRETEDERFFQKYSAGARWYPARHLTIDFGGYYKINQYDYDHTLDSTLNTGGNRYPAYLVMQDFETRDVHAGITLRPLPSVTLASRYEFQLSTIHTRPDAASGLPEVESSEMTSHIFAQNISWSPCSRWFLQAGVNYVLSETETPTSDFTPAILDSQNNYLTLNISSGLVLDDRTDLNVGYFYYRADNYRDNSLDGVPYGAGAEEHGITVTLARRLTERLRLNLRYGYFHHEDEPSRGREDFDAHGVFTSLQYRF